MISKRKLILCQILLANKYFKENYGAQSGEFVCGWLKWLRPHHERELFSKEAVLQRKHNGSNNGACRSETL